MATWGTPRLIDSAAHKLELTPGTYVDLVDQTLGNAGHPSDGFEAYLSDTMQITANGFADLPAGDAHIADAGAQLPGFDTPDGATLASELEGPSAAADSALSDFNVAVPPTPQGGGTGTPPPSTPPPAPSPYDTGTPAGTKVGLLTVGQPDPNPYPAIPTFDAPSPTVTLPVMATDNGKLVREVGHGNISYNHLTFGVPDETILDSGDRAIFSLDNPIAVHAGGSESWVATLTVNPVKVGRFSCMISTPDGNAPHNPSGGNVGSDYRAHQFNVTIVKAP